jgi:hypothetical protein
MAAERKCLQCEYAVESDEQPSVEEVLRGVEPPHICIYNPPLVTALGTPQGIVMMTSRPLVNDKTISCAHWEARHGNTQ